MSTITFSEALGLHQLQQILLPEQEQQQLLDAIQAQEDRTQEKLREREGTVVRGHRNW